MDKENNAVINAAQCGKHSLLLQLFPYLLGNPLLVSCWNVYIDQGFFPYEPGVFSRDLA